MVFKCELAPRCNVTSFMTCPSKDLDLSEKWQESLMRSRIVAVPLNTASKALSKSSMSVQCLLMTILMKCIQSYDARNGSKNPNVPIEKLSTGGTAPWLKSEEACRIVPSPPSVIIKSIRSDSGPVDTRLNHRARRKYKEAHLGTITDFPLPNRQKLDSQIEL